MKAKKLLIIPLLSLLCLGSNAYTRGLSDLENKIKNYPLAKKEEQLLLLEKLVNINSGTENIAGVNKVGAILQQEFEALGFKTHWAEEPTDLHRAPTLIAEHPGTTGKKLLLIGHLDTVFPESGTFQKFTRQGNTATGPGVIDDKGGDVIILYALKALMATHVITHANITVVLTGDEESSGKPASISRKPLIEIAKQRDIALDFEPSATRDTASIARRGITEWSITTQGKEGHSSLIFKQEFGDGAILEMARILNGLRTTFSNKRYVTFNPGIILGGTQLHYDKTMGKGSSFGKTNIIAKEAIASGDLRYLTPEQQQWAKHIMVTTINQHLPVTRATVQFQDGMPPMPPTSNNLKLLQHYSQISQNLGYGQVTPLPPDLRGGGDISYIANSVTANLVGLGAIGMGEHTPQETLKINSLVMQSQRAALLIYALTK